MTDHYAVVGNPVAHSKSPQIHSHFAHQTRQDLDYRTLELPLDSFESGIKDFFSQADNKGLNVTVPFKEQAFAMCEVISERARRAGAVNTLWLEDGRLRGDTTDGLGLVTDLKANHALQLNNKKILIVGAGGAVRGVLQPILEEKPASITLCNRTLAKLDPLVDAFSDIGLLDKKGFSELSGQFDLIINGTSAGLAGGVPDLPDDVVGPQTTVYDMIYGKEVTSFNRWALERGAAQAVDGLGMLVEQAAEAFRLWRGMRPDTAQILASLRAC